MMRSGAAASAPLGTSLLLLVSISMRFGAVLRSWGFPSGPVRPAVGLIYFIPRFLATKAQVFYLHEVQFEVRALCATERTAVELPRV